MLSGAAKAPHPERDLRRSASEASSARRALSAKVRLYRHSCRLDRREDHVERSWSPDKSSGRHCRVLRREALSAALLNLEFYGWFGNLLVATIGAVLVLWVWRTVASYRY